MDAICALSPGGSRRSPGVSTQRRETSGLLLRVCQGEAMPNLKTSPIPGSRWKWNERAEEIISDYLQETGQEPNGVVLSVSTLREHFDARLNEDDYTLMRFYLSRRAKVEWRERRTAWNAEFRISAIHKPPWHRPQEYRIEKRRPRWGSRRGDQGG